MLALIIVCSVVLYVFGGLVVGRIFDARWHLKNCSWDDHFDCEERWGIIFLGIFWPVALPGMLIGLALWKLAVVVSDLFTPKKED